MSRNSGIGRRAVLAGSIAALATAGARRAEAQGASASVARLWAGLTLQDASGRRFRLGDIRQPLKLVKLWANWCPGCLAELPSFEAAVGAVGADSLDVTFVSHPEFWPRDLAAAQRRHIPFRLATLAPENARSAVDAALTDRDGAFAVPRTLLFRGGAEPNLAWTHLGSRDWSGAASELRG